MTRRKIIIIIIIVVVVIVVITGAEDSVQDAVPRQCSKTLDVFHLLVKFHSLLHCFFTLLFERPITWLTRLFILLPRGG